MEIYAMYGRQEERHVQELEELEAKLSATTSLFLGTITRLKDGSLKIEDVELADGKLQIPGPTTPVAPEAATGNGTQKAEAKAGARGNR